MKSPITGKEMILQKESRTLSFRKEEFPIVYHYFLCKESKEQFTSAELDEINVNQLYNQYREKYNIPFPDEIKEIRSKFGLSAVKMSEALGFGINIYRNYENGEVPNESNGKLIRMAQDPKGFKQLIELSRTLEQLDKEKILKRTEELIEAEKQNNLVVDLSDYFFGSRIPDEYSGYRKPNIEKFTEMVIFFAEKMQPWKTKLNKLLFYADFFCFRQTCFSMSGVRYRAIDLGPVPNNFNAIYEFIANRNDIEIFSTESANGFSGEQFKPTPQRPFNTELFSKEELIVLNDTVKVFAKTSAQDIIEISHKEKAWKENYSRGKQLISYKYGFDLKAI
jgi:putative zinc finger/helix-turn-helix YgiT family protein